MKASEIFAVLKKDGILLEISGLPPEVDISGIAYESGKVKNGLWCLRQHSARSQTVTIIFPKR